MSILQERISRWSYGIWFDEFGNTSELDLNFSINVSSGSIVLKDDSSEN